MVLNLGAGGIDAPADVLQGRREVKVDLRQPTDVVADIRHLPFDDDCADAVYASHVIEHISESEVVSAVAEWRRVLKPGGKLYVNCPDVASAAALIARSGVDALAYVTDGGIAIRAQDVLFGYAPWTDECAEMRHRVAFDMRKLGGVLERAGFTNGEVHQYPQNFALEAWALK